MGLAQNLTRSNILRAKSGWNNGSLSRSNNTVRGLLSTRVPHQNGATGGGIRNPSYGIGTTGLAYTQRIGRWVPPTRRGGVIPSDLTTFIGE